MTGRQARKSEAKEQPNKPRKYGSKFNTEWKLKKEYSSWLTGVEGDDSRACHPWLRLRIHMRIRKGGSRLTRIQKI